MPQHVESISGCAYAVDAQDRIAAVDGGWRQFAMENDGEMLIADRVLRRSLWDYIRGIENRLIYKRVLDHVRQSGESVAFDLRCDSPTLERHLRMEVALLPENGCLFQTQLVRYEVREAVLLLSREAVRSLCSVAVCGWCMCVEVSGHWLPLPDAVQRLADHHTPVWPNLAHTICPDCFARLDALLTSSRLTWHRLDFGADLRP